VLQVYRHFGPKTVWTQDTSAPTVPMRLDTLAPMCDKYEQETRLLLIQCCLNRNRLFYLVYISTSLLTGDADDIQTLLRPGCCLAISAAQVTEVCRRALFRAKELNLTRRRLEMSCVKVIKRHETA